MPDFDCEIQRHANHLLSRESYTYLWVFLRKLLETDRTKFRKAVCFALDCGFTQSPWKEQKEIPWDFTLQT